jgi:hypothetical protein
VDRIRPDEPRQPPVRGRAPGGWSKRRGIIIIKKMVQTILKITTGLERNMDQFEASVVSSVKLIS